MLRSVRLQHFRSYTDESFEFDDGVNIIVGPNASGKTNLLEAVLVLCSGSSYRHKDSDLVQFGARWARLDSTGQNNSTRTLKLHLTPVGAKKELELDGKTIKKLTLKDTLPAVLFEPNHLLLLHGPPDLRRDYLDTLLERTVAGYARLRQDYRRTLAQRNTLLKRISGKKAADLFVWDVRLSQLGGQIALERSRLVDVLNKKINEQYQALSRTKRKAAIYYQSGCNISQYSSTMLRALESNQEKDIARGFTGAGPHRDDMVIELDGHNAQQTASRGEIRSLVLVLKIMEAVLIEEARQKKPLLLLDDVFSELDGTRRRALTETLKDQQVFITTTDADIVIKRFLAQCRIIPLQK